MLTDTQARNAKPAVKPYKLSDAQGLYLFVRPTGSKQWRFDYAFNARRKTLTIGAFVVSPCGSPRPGKRNCPGFRPVNRR